MKKITLVIGIILVIVVILGMYFLFLNPNRKTATNFTIQGMRVQVLQQGKGIEARGGDMVTVNDETWVNGVKIYSAIDNHSPTHFELRASNTTEGFYLGIVGMKIGEKRRLTIPPELAYGSAGFPQSNIPPNATMTVEVELLKIN